MEVTDWYCSSIHFQSICRHEAREPAEQVLGLYLWWERGIARIEVVLCWWDHRPCSRMGQSLSWYSARLKDYGNRWMWMPMVAIYLTMRSSNHRWGHLRLDSRGNASALESGVFFHSVVYTEQDWCGHCSKVVQIVSCKACLVDEHSLMKQCSLVFWWVLGIGFDHYPLLCVELTGPLYIQSMSLTLETLLTLCKCIPFQCFEIASEVPVCLHPLTIYKSTWAPR